jgi:hypothetical protein
MVDSTGATEVTGRVTVDIVVAACEDLLGADDTAAAPEVASEALVGITIPAGNFAAKRSTNQAGRLSRAIS